IPCLLSRGMAMAQRRCSTIGISYLVVTVSAACLLCASTICHGDASAILADIAMTTEIAFIVNFIIINHLTEQPARIT
ncbi:hypothetical protein ACK35C_14790, partial [Aeromonas veronii]